MGIVPGPRLHHGRVDLRYPSRNVPGAPAENEPFRSAPRSVRIQETGSKHRSALFVGCGSVERGGLRDGSPSAGPAAWIPREQAP